jgi:hypothetical protein
LPAGLVTEVPANFRVYILEYMAHLSLQDWKAVGDDFVNLQFIAPGSKHPNEIPGLMDAVGAVLEVLMLGGGAKSLENIRVRSALLSLFLTIQLRRSLIMNVTNSMALLAQIMMRMHFAQ